MAPGGGEVLERTRDDTAGARLVGGAGLGAGCCCGGRRRAGGCRERGSWLTTAVLEESDDAGAPAADAAGHTGSRRCPLSGSRLWPMKTPGQREAEVSGMARRRLGAIILGLSPQTRRRHRFYLAVADFTGRGLTYLEDLTLDPRPAVREAAERGLRELTWFLEAIEALEVIETLADAVETDAAEAIARGKELLVSLREWIWREGPWDHGRTAEALQWVPGLTEADIPRLRGLLMSVRPVVSTMSRLRTESLGTVTSSAKPVNEAGGT